MKGGGLCAGPWGVVQVCGWVCVWGGGGLCSAQCYCCAGYVGV